MQTKNNVESTKNTLTKSELDKLAKKDVVDLKFDIDEDILNTLKLIHLEEAPDISFEELVAFSNKKDAGSIFCSWMINVLLSSGLGKTLMVISLKTASVPNEPDKILLKS